MKERICNSCGKDVGHKYVYIHLMDTSVKVKNVYFHIECFTLIAGKEYMDKLVDNSSTSPGSFNEKLRDLQTYDRDSSYDEWYKGEPT